MTAPVPAPVRRPVALLVPLAAGAVVAVALGVYGRQHEPSHRALWLGPFPSMISMKVWLTVVVLAFAAVQLITALWMYGKLGVPYKKWVGPLHRASGTIAFLVSLPVAFHCLWSIGFETEYGARNLAHGILGCAFYGAFVAKLLTLHSKRVPNWALPWVAGTMFTILVAAGSTSAIWYLSVRGIPN